MWVHLKLCCDAMGLRGPATDIHSSCGGLRGVSHACMYIYRVKIGPRFGVSSVKNWSKSSVKNWSNFSLFSAFL